MFTLLSSCLRPRRGLASLASNSFIPPTRTRRRTQAKQRRRLGCDGNCAARRCLETRRSKLPRGHYAKAATSPGPLELESSLTSLQRRRRSLRVQPASRSRATATSMCHVRSNTQPRRHRDLTIMGLPQWHDAANAARASWCDGCVRGWLAMWRERTGAISRPPAGRQDEHPHWTTRPAASTPGRRSHFAAGTFGCTQAGGPGHDLASPTRGAAAGAPYRRGGSPFAGAAAALALEAWVSWPQCWVLARRGHHSGVLVGGATAGPGGPGRPGPLKLGTTAHASVLAGRRRHAVVRGSVQPNAARGSHLLSAAGECQWHPWIVLYRYNIQFGRCPD